MVLLTIFCDPQNFTTFEFCRQGQPKYPPASFKSARADREVRIDDPAKERGKKVVTPKETVAKKTVRVQERTDGKICFLSVLRQYKVVPTTIWYRRCATPDARKCTTTNYPPGPRARASKKRRSRRCYYPREGARSSWAPS
jgi:hypothetical protein